MYLLQLVEPTGFLLLLTFAHFLNMVFTADEDREHVEFLERMQKKMRNIKKALRTALRRDANNNNDRDEDDDLQANGEHVQYRDRLFNRHFRTKLSLV